MLKTQPPWARWLSSFQGHCPEMGGVLGAQLQLFALRLGAGLAPRPCFAENAGFNELLDGGITFVSSGTTQLLDLMDGEPQRQLVRAFCAAVVGSHVPNLARSDVRTAAYDAKKIPRVAFVW